LESHTIPELYGKATYCIDSGNGISPFFSLNEPLNIDGDFTGYEALNNQVGKAWSGATTHNCDRVMRLPGTWNYPNDAKISKGYPSEPRMAKLLFSGGPTYSQDGIREMVRARNLSNKFWNFLESAPAVAARYSGSSEGLVDKSGSMCGDKDQFALAATLLVNEVCSTLNIPVEIIGFTDDNIRAGEGISPVMYVYKNFSDHSVSTEDLKKSYAMSSRVMQGNPDAENILWAHDRLVKRKEKKKLLIVMSDGSPAATKGGSGIGRFTENVIREIEASKDVEIYGLGLCSDSVEHYYKANSVVNEPQDIPVKLLELIERKILR
jgi:hypothetical protein